MVCEYNGNFHGHSLIPLTFDVFVSYDLQVENMICHCVVFAKLTFFDFLQEWSNNTYPPWAHGPGYILSQDIAHFVVEGHKKNLLKVCISSCSSSEPADSLHMYVA